MPQTDLSQIQDMMKEGQWKQAREQLEELRQSVEPDARFYLSLAQVRAVEGKLSAVVETYLEWSRQSLQQGRFEEAEEAIKNALSLAPESIDGRRMKLELARSQSQPDRALELTRELARLVMEKGEGEMALSLLREACEEHPDHLELRQELAEGYISYGQIQDGAMGLQRVANALKDRGEVERAVLVLKRLSLVRPDDPQLLMELGRLHRQTGSHKEAEETFRAILRLDLEHQEALFELGSVCLDQGRFRSALLAFNKVLQGHPDSAPALAKVGEVQNLMGDPDGAVESWLKAAHLYLECESERDQAAACFRFVLGIEAENSLAQQGLLNLGLPVESAEPEPMPRAGVAAPASSEPEAEVEEKLVVSPSAQTPDTPSPVESPPREATPKRPGLVRKQPRLKAKRKLKPMMGDGRGGGLIPKTFGESAGSKPVLVRATESAPPAVEPEPDVEPTDAGEEMVPCYEELFEVPPKAEPALPQLTLTESGEAETTEPVDLEEGKPDFLPGVAELDLGEPAPVPDLNLWEDELFPSSEVVPASSVGSDLSVDKVEDQPASSRDTEPVKPEADLEENDLFAHLDLGSEEPSDLVEDQPASSLDTEPVEPEADLEENDLFAHLELGLEEPTCTVEDQPASSLETEPVEPEADLEENDLFAHLDLGFEEPSDLLEDQPASSLETEPVEPEADLEENDLFAHLDLGFEEPTCTVEDEPASSLETVPAEPEADLEENDLFAHLELGFKEPSDLVEDQPASSLDTEPVEPEADLEENDLFAHLELGFKEPSDLVEDEPASSLDTEPVEPEADLEENDLFDHLDLDLEESDLVDHGPLPAQQEAEAASDILGDLDGLLRAPEEDSPQPVGEVVAEEEAYPELVAREPLPELPLPEGVVLPRSQPAAAPATPKELLDEAPLRADKLMESLRSGLERDSLNMALRRQLGDLYLRYGMPEEALREYERILNYRPDDLEVLHLALQTDLWLDDLRSAADRLLTLARLHLDRGDFQKGLDNLGVLLSLEPAHAEARQALVTVFLAQNETSLASFHLAQAVEDDLKRGEARQAERSLERFLESHFDPRLQERLVDLYEAGGRKEQAARCLMELAEHYEVAERWKDSARMAERALQLVPEQRPIRSHLVRLYEQLGDEDRTREQYLELAQAAAERGEHQEVLDTCCAVVERHPQDIMARELMTRAYLAQDSLDPALEQLHFLLENGWSAESLYPHLLARHTRYAGPLMNLLLQRNQIEMAARVLNAADAERPGLAKEVLGEEPAEDELEGRANHAMLRYHLGHTDRAIELFQQLRRYPAYEVRAYRMLGQCFSSKQGFNMLELGLRQFRKALESPQATPEELLEVRYDLATVLERHGRPEQALDQLRFLPEEFRDVALRKRELEG